MSVLDLLGDEINAVGGGEEQSQTVATTTTTIEVTTNPPSTITNNNTVPPITTTTPLSTEHSTNKNSSNTSQASSSSSNAKPWGRLVLVSTGCTDIPSEFSLVDDVINIGRMQSNNVRIFSKQQSKFVSRNHAQIRKINFFTFEITDQKSMNGTLVNGKKIDTVKLKHGDLIIITGGTTANVGEYISAGDKKRQMFANEQDWKYELIAQLKQAFIYKFELLDQEAIMKSLSSATVERFVSNQEASKATSSETSASNLSKTNTTTEHNKRKLDETDLSSSSNDETGKKFKALTECCSSEFNCCICYNLFVEPTVLECGHNFCKRCLYEWLAKNHSCPLCRKKLSKGSYPNRGMENILNAYVQHVSCAEEQKLREERIKLIQHKFDEDLAKLHGMIENAKAKKIKFLNIKDRWKLEEKRTFKNGVKQYFGKCREDFCNLVGMTENFVNSCSNEELIIACDNLEIPVAYMIVGQEIKTMRRVVDFDQTRQRLLNFWNAVDNLFFI